MKGFMISFAAEYVFPLLETQFTYSVHIVFANNALRNAFVLQTKKNLVLIVVENYQLSEIYTMISA